MTTGNADYAGELPKPSSVPIDELARRKRVRLIRSAEDLAQDGVFETDEELDAFLAHVSASRHADFV